MPKAKPGQTVDERLDTLESIIKTMKLAPRNAPASPPLTSESPFRIDQQLESPAIVSNYAAHFITYVAKFFQLDIDNAIHEETIMKFFNESPIFRYSVMSLSAISIDPKAKQMSLMYFNKACLQEKDFVYESTSSNATLQYILAMTVLTVTSPRLGLLHLPKRFLSNGTRMALETGINREITYSNVTPSQGEIMRRVWWHIYKFDRFYSEVPNIRDNDCDIRLAWRKNLVENPEDSMIQRKMMNSEAFFILPISYLCEDAMLIENVTLLISKHMGKLHDLDILASSSYTDHLYTMQIFQSSIDHCVPETTAFPQSFRQLWSIAKQGILIMTYKHVVQHLTASPMMDSIITLQSSPHILSVFKHSNAMIKSLRDYLMNCGKPVFGKTEMVQCWTPLVICQFIFANSILITILLKIYKGSMEAAQLKENFQFSCNGLKQLSACPQLLDDQMVVLEWFRYNEDIKVEEISGYLQRSKLGGLAVEPLSPEPGFIKPLEMVGLTDAHAYGMYFIEPDHPARLQNFEGWVKEEMNGLNPSFQFGDGISGDIMMPQFISDDLETLERTLFA